MVLQISLCVFSEKELFHKTNTCVVSFPHELLDCATLDYLFVRNCFHRLNTCVISCPHELLQYMQIENTLF